MVLLIVNMAYANLLVVNSQTGSDANTRAQVISGSKWATLMRAVNGSATRSSPNTSEAAQAGDTVLVEYGTNGIYDASAADGTRNVPAFIVRNDGSSGSWIVIKGDTTGGQTITLRSTNGTGPVAGFYTNNYVEWNSFYIDESYVNSEPDTGPFVIWDSDSTRTFNIEILGDDKDFGDNHNGIRIEASDRFHIKNCKIRKVYQDVTDWHHNSSGIMLYANQQGTIENCEFDSCGSGIYIKGESVAQQDSNIIRFNLFTNNAKAVRLGHSNGTSVSKMYSNIIQTRNTAGSIGIDISEGTTNWWITNNTIYNASNYGNGIYWSGNHRGGGGAAPGPDDGSDHAFNAGNASGVSSMTFDYNCYYSNGANPWAVNSTAYSTLSAWQAVVTGDDNSITTQANFTSFPTDLTITSGVGYQAGIDILDLDGDASTVDAINMGAYATGSETIGLDFTAGTPSDPPATVTTRINLIKD